MNIQVVELVNRWLVERGLPPVVEPATDPAMAGELARRISEEVTRG